MGLKIKPPTNDNHIPECELFPHFGTEAEFKAWRKEEDRLAKEEIRQGLGISDEQVQAEARAILKRWQQKI